MNRIGTVILVLLVGVAAMLVWRFSGRSVPASRLASSSPREIATGTNGVTAAREEKGDTNNGNPDRNLGANWPSSTNALANVPGIRDPAQQAQHDELVKTINEASGRIVNSSLIRTGEVIRFLQSASQFFEEAVAIQFGTNGGKVIPLEQNGGQTKIYQNEKTGDFIIFSFWEDGKIAQVRRRGETTSTLSVRLSFYPDGKLKVFSTSGAEKKSKNVIGLSSEGMPEYLHVVISDNQFFSAALGDGAVIRQKVRDAASLSPGDWLRN